MTKKTDGMTLFLIDLDRDNIDIVALFSLFPIVESLRLSFYRMILTLPWLGQRMVGWENTPTSPPIPSRATLS